MKIFSDRKANVNALSFAALVDFVRRRVSVLCEW